MPKVELRPEDYYQKTKGICIASGVFNQHLSYYWMYPTIEAVDDVLFQRLDNYDINRLYHNYLPEMIFTNPRWRKSFKEISRSLELDDYQNEILKRHFPDIKKLNSYMEIKPGVYQKQK